MACDTPFFVRPKGWLQDVPVPCGRCPPCKKRRVDGWVFRLMQEERVSTSAHFITLTYDPDHVPISPNGFMTLDKSEFPRYMKRLRKLVVKDSGGLWPNLLKYYACGEYGSKGSRPHYHAIVFNVPDDKLFYEAWSLNGVPFGSVHVGQVSGDSVAYTMKYIDKSSFRFAHSRDDRVPEFALMSKGLGRSYVTDAVKAYHHQDYSRLFLVKDGGHKIALPRYYRSLIYDADDSGFQRSLVEAAVSDADDKNFEYFTKRFGKVPGYDYSEFVYSQRMARYNSFYSNQKIRDYETT